MACFNYCGAHTHATHMSNAGWLILSSGEKWLASTKWPMTFNLRTLYSRRLQWHPFFFLPCHWQSAFTRGHGILLVDQCVNDISVVRYASAGCRLQCACNTRTATSVQWAVTWKHVVVRVLIMVFIRGQQTSWEELWNLILHFQVIVLYLVFSGSLCMQTLNSNFTCSALWFPQCRKHNQIPRINITNSVKCKTQIIMDIAKMRIKFNKIWVFYTIKIIFHGSSLYWQLSI